MELLIGARPSCRGHRLLSGGATINGALHCWDTIIDSADAFYRRNIIEQNHPGKSELDMSVRIQGYRNPCQIGRDCATVKIELDTHQKDTNSKAGKYDSTLPGEGAQDQRSFNQPDSNAITHTH